MQKNFFSPKAIAIVGASKNKESVGFGIMQNILNANRQVKVFPVNPKYKKVLGKKCYKSLSSIKYKPIDMVVIAIPAKFVASVINEGVKKEIKNYIVISAGFKETGEEGLKLENELKDLIIKNNLNVLGPNCLGFLDSYSKSNISFAKGMIEKGKIGFMSQSGAICTAMLDWSKEQKVGFSKFVSLGNKAGIDEVEILKYFENDKNTKYIIAYLESIGRGQEFISVASRITKSKPIFVLMGGVSKMGQKAAGSHTGALTSSNDVLTAAFKKAGIVQIKNIAHFFGLADYLNSQPILSGNKIAIIANAGGPAVLTTDLIESSDLQMAKFSNSTLEKLKKALPPVCAKNNPIDLVGDAGAERYKVGLELALQDKNVDGAIVLLTPQTMTQVDQTAKTIIDINKRYSKPVAVSFIGGETVKSGKKILKKSVAEYNFPVLPVRVFGYVYQAVANTKKMTNKPSSIALQKNNWTQIQQILTHSKKQVDFLQSIEILKMYGINFVETKLIKDPGDIGSMNYPVVAKIYSDKVVHKTDVGGIIPDIKTKGDLASAFYKMKNIEGFRGILVQPMTSGKEVVIGIHQDASFGPSIMFGLGGIYVNILKDVNFAIGPVDKPQALDLIKSIKAYPILQGFRGGEKVNIDSIADVIVKLSHLATDFPQIKEIDLNPVFADEKGVKLVDVRIIV